jgi:putative tricarboxylic transport membrane protein
VNGARGFYFRLSTFAFLLCAFAAANAQGWKPEKNVEIVSSSGPGGASDRQARTVQGLLQAMPGIPSVTVNNRPGGGGTVALTVLAQHPADAHYLYVMQTGILVNRIVGVATIGYRDLTPLAMLMREHIIAWVKADSPVASGQDLVARLRKSPTDLAFGLSNTRGNQNHIVIAMLARAAGVDPKAVKVVVYSSGAQGITATLGGHVDVWVGSAASVLPHLQTGAARVLGIGAAERQPGPLAAVPTFREQGIDAVFSDARGFIGPRDLAPAQVAFWSGAFARMVEGEAWKKDLARYAWEPDYRSAADTRKFLDERMELLTQILGELGLVKR